MKMLLFLKNIILHTIGLTISPPCIQLLKIYSTKLKFWIQQLRDVVWFSNVILLVY